MEELTELKEMTELKELKVLFFFFKNHLSGFSSVCSFELSTRSFVRLSVRWLVGLGSLLSLLFTASSVSCDAFPFGCVTSIGDT